MKALLAVTAVLVAAVAVCVAFTLPPPHTPLPAAGDRSVAGVVHVHSSRSDGSSSPEQIAAAAARAGLKFLVFTDHGDATRTPDPPTYRSGVLCLDGVEISTNGGHYVAFDMPASPYPLAGDARDVVEDVRRLGGFGVAAHPDSPKPQLRWTDWSAPFDGIELLNPDSSWRRLAQDGWRSRGRLLSALADYPFRGAETIDGLLQPSSVVRQWLALAGRRRVVAMAGVDAHARIDLRGDPIDSEARLSLPLPSYEATFRAMALHVAIDRPLTGTAAAADSAVLMRAIRAGHFYTALDGVAGPPAFEFTATNDLGTVHEGDELGASGDVTLHVASNAPSSYTTVVHSGEQAITSVRDPQQLVVHASAGPAVYWVEILARGAAVPWLRSNPIYVRGAAPATSGIMRTPATETVPLPAGAWRTEHDPASDASLAAVGAADNDVHLFRFSLGGGLPGAQVAAVAVDTPHGIADYTRVGFTARADKPMRLSVQLRSDGATPQRWQRSVYVDRFDRDRIVFLDDVTPVGKAEAKPPLDRIRSVMFVVDVTNTRPGTSGQIWIRGASLER